MGERVHFDEESALVAAEVGLGRALFDHKVGALCSDDVGGV